MDVPNLIPRRSVADYLVGIVKGLNYEVTLVDLQAPPVPIPPPSMDLSVNASRSAASIEVGGVVDFMCSPVGGTGPYTYMWEFDDPHTYTTTVTEQNPSHVFEWAGNHQVKVTVTDSIGATQWVALDVTVEIDFNIVEVDAVLDIGLDNTGIIDCTLSLNAYIDANYDNTTGLRINFPSGTYRFHDRDSNGHVSAIEIRDNVNDIHKIEFVGIGEIKCEFVFYNNSTVTGKHHGFFHLHGANTNAPEPTYIRVANLAISMEKAPSEYEQYPEFMFGGDVGSRREFQTIEDCTIRNFGRVTYASNAITRRCNLIGCGNFSIEMFRFATDGLAKQCYIGAPDDQHSHHFYYTGSTRTHIIDTFGDGSNTKPGRLFISWKMACHDNVMRGNLFMSTDGYAVQLGGYDGAIYDVELSDNRFVGPSFGIWLFSANGDVDIYNNFFSGFHDNTAHVMIAGHDHTIESGGLDTIGVTFADNVCGNNAPNGSSGQVVKNGYKSHADDFVYDVTEEGTVNDSSLFLTTDPEGWHNDQGYIDPGEFAPTPPVADVTIDNGQTTTASQIVTLEISLINHGSGMGPVARFPFKEGGVMQVSNNIDTWSNTMIYTQSIQWLLTLNSGDKTVYVRVRDKDGNWSQPTSNTITLV